MRPSTRVVARRLADLLAAPPGDVPALAALAPAGAPRRAIAVDGSQVVLADSGDLLLAAFRAGAVGVERGAALPAVVPEPEVVLVTRATAAGAVGEAIEGDGFAAPAEIRADPAGALGALRAMAELRAASAALERLGEGDVLLLDGALRVRVLVPQLDAVLARAAERGVAVVGVCKSTGLAIGHAPALVACGLAAREAGLRTWWAPLGTPPYVRGASFAARLSAAEDRAFRFDVASGDPAVLARLAGLCGHPAYPGYPSPLAMAHKAVVIQEDARVRLRAEVQEAAEDAGVGARAWSAAFVDYHDVLELGA